MKLVKLMAMHISKWPIVDGEECGFIVQEEDGELYSTHNVAPLFSGEATWHRAAGDDLKCGYFGLNLDLANDWSSAIVTRADWEAERAKLKAPKANGDGWIRHRGGKCPVDGDTVVDIRCRNGRVYEGELALHFIWKHSNDIGDTMAYRIHKPAEQLAPVSEEAIQVGIDAADAGKLTPIAEVKARILSRKTARAMKDAEEGNLAKFGSIDELMQDLGEPAPRPLEWRNRIYELDTQHAEVESDYQRQISEITQERESLVQKLAGEGLALVEAVRPGEEILDWTDWKIGDVLTSTADGGGYTSGKTYKFLGMTAWGTARTLDDDGKESGMMPFCFAWHSRPAS